MATAKEVVHMLVKAVFASGEFVNVVVPPMEDGEHDLLITLHQAMWENKFEVPTLVMEDRVIFSGRFVRDTNAYEQWLAAFDAVSDIAEQYCDCR